jgi:hypothetical protein
MSTSEFANEVFGLLNFRYDGRETDINSPNASFGHLRYLSANGEGWHGMCTSTTRSSFDIKDFQTLNNSMRILHPSGTGGMGFYDNFSTSQGGFASEEP